MKLIKITKKEDFGIEYIIQVINIKKLSLFQVSVSWNDYASWPYFQLKSGTGDVLNVLFWAYKIGIDFTILGRTWGYDLLKTIDEKEKE